MSRPPTSSSSRSGIFRLAGQLGGRRAGRHAGDFQPLRRDALGEVADHQGRGRARAEADDHPVSDQARPGDRRPVPCLAGESRSVRRVTPTWSRQRSFLSEQAAIARAGQPDAAFLESAGAVPPGGPRIGATRFELVTSCSQGRRANQAALRPAYCSASRMLSGVRDAVKGGDRGASARRPSVRSRPGCSPDRLRLIDRSRPLARHSVGLVGPETAASAASISKRRLTTRLQRTAVRGEDRAEERNEPATRPSSGSDVRCGRVRRTRDRPALVVRVSSQRDLETAVDDSPAQHGVRRSADPASARQATNASSPAPAASDRNRRRSSSPVGAIQLERPSASANHERQDGSRSSNKPAQRRSNHRQRQRPIDHLEPIEQHLELLIRPLQLVPGVPASVRPTSRLKR